MTIVLEETFDSGLIDMNTWTFQEASHGVNQNTEYR